MDIPRSPLLLAIDASYCVSVTREMRVVYGEVIGNFLVGGRKTTTTVGGCHDFCICSRVVLQQ